MSFVISTSVISSPHVRDWNRGLLRIPDDGLEILRKLYLADTAYADERFGALIAKVRTEGILDETLLIIVGDHGENLGEHDMVDHQFGLQETLLRIPMIVRLPGTFDPVTERLDPVQLVDVAPTVLDVLGWEPDTWQHMQGVSLLNEEIAFGRPVLAEYMRPVRQRIIYARAHPEFDFGKFDRRIKSLQVGDLKLIAFERGTTELYDLAADPSESHNLASQRPDDVRRLTKQLMTIVGSWDPPEGGEPDLDEEAKEALRSLGYLH